MNEITIPDRPRKHRWVTEALSQGSETVSVWPSPDDLKTDKRRRRFMETIAKVGNDPRVKDVTKHRHDVYSFVFVFHLEGE
jgi:cytochrome P450